MACNTFSRPGLLQYSPLGLDLIAVRLMLRLEIEVLMGWTKEHLTAHCQHLHTERLLHKQLT